MKKRFLYTGVALSFFILMMILCCNAFSQTKTQKIIVDKNGKGNFTSIQKAIESLSDSSVQPRIIVIKNGTYNEKIFITKHNIVLEGESRDKTIITQAIARDEWRCSHPDDWGVATMNIDGNDITLENLTVINSYGFDNKKERVINCPMDSVTHKKTISAGGHQMALRTMKATRLKAINVHFKAFAGDTVSPWNVEDGMFYFKDCIMEGGVDFYCPRGWAYAENCRFIANTGPASIWHDGSANEDSKTVLKDCSFEGFDNFNLGRYHKDAQFYLINCRFAKNMADKDIYLVPTTNKIQWGRRVYYYNCHREGGDYDWFKNNLASAKDAPSSDAINASWVFKDRWNPLLTTTNSFKNKISNATSIAKHSEDQ
jgi:pectinesterase